MQNAATEEVLCMPELALPLTLFSKQSVTCNDAVNVFNEIRDFACGHSFLLHMIEKGFQRFIGPFMIRNGLLLKGVIPISRNRKMKVS